MYLVTASEMRDMDQRTIESLGIPGRVLMESAGRGATRFLFDTVGDLSGRKIGIAAGRGNNGGDGFVIARYLAQKNIDATVYLLSTKEKVKGDAAANLDLLFALDVPVVEVPDEDAFVKCRASLLEKDVWVDAILGTGLNSDVRGFYKKIIEFINGLKKPVFSVDIPSGLNSDTGRPCGTSIRANATATFAFAKTGHLLYPGAEYTGKLKIVDIGIPYQIATGVGPRHNLLTRDSVRSGFGKRPADAHKGSTGHLLVLAGSPGKIGAASMTSVSALRAGAGLVTCGIPSSLNCILETLVREAMTYPIPENGEGIFDEFSLEAAKNQLAGKKCLAVGPGLGTAPGTVKFVLELLKECATTVVADADGLNCLAENVEMLKELKIPVILTPHPGEMARLMNTTTSDVQKDRIGCARHFATEYNVHVVLKGAGTVIAHPDGEIFINATGNSGMASGGMGDVLTGVIAGLATQGYPADQAARIGVFLHGAAADSLAEKTGPFGYLAGEVMDAIPEQIRDLIKGDNRFRNRTLPERSI